MPGPCQGYARAVPGPPQPGSPGALSPFVCKFRLGISPFTGTPGRCRGHGTGTLPAALGALGTSPGGCNGKLRADYWEFFSPKSSFSVFLSWSVMKTTWCPSKPAAFRACSQNSSPGMELVVPMCQDQGCPPSCVSLTQQRPGATSRRGISPAGPEGRLLAELWSECSYESSQIPPGSIPWNSLVPSQCQDRDVVIPLVRRRALPSEDAPGGFRCPAALGLSAAPILGFLLQRCRSPGGGETAVGGTRFVFTLRAQLSPPRALFHHFRG